MRFSIKKLSRYRYGLLNKKNEVINVFHIDDLWDTEDADFHYELDGAEINTIWNITLAKEVSHD